MGFVIGVNGVVEADGIDGGAVKISLVIAGAYSYSLLIVIGCCFSSAKSSKKSKLSSVRTGEMAPFSILVFCRLADGDWP